MKRTTRNPEKSRKEIIEKAAPVFNKYGYAGTKMDMIIKATGFQKGGIYGHFESKMDLARAVFKYNYQLLKKTYEKELDPTASPKDQLLSLLKGFQSYIINPPIIGGCPLMNMAIEADDTDETNRLLVKTYLDKWKKEIEEILEAGIQADEFKEDINTSQEAYFFIATIEGSIMLGQTKKSVGLMMDISDSLKRYIELRIFK